MDVFTLKGTISVDTSTAKTDINAVKDAAENLKTTLNGLETSANNAETELDQVATAANNADTELGGLDTASAAVKNSMDALDRILDDVEQELKQFDTAADNAADELGDIDTQGTKAKTTLQHVGTYATTAGTNLDSGSSFSIGAHYAADLLWELSERAAEFAWELGKMGIDFNASMETWSLQLTTLLGADNIEVGKAFLDEIRQFAIDTPLSLDQAVQSAISLLSSGVNSEDVIDTLWMLGDIAQGDTEKLSRIALVYSQILAGGKMQGDDLRQFKNAGVPIYDLLEQYYEATNKGVDYTHDMLADMQAEGEITAEDVRGALLMATQEGGLFYKAMETMMGGYEGQVEKFKDSTQQTMGELTSSFFELLKTEALPKLTEMMAELMQWAKDNPEVIDNLSKALSDLAVNGLTAVVDGLTSLLTFWNENRALFDSLLVLFGGMAFAAGHPMAGLALISVGGYDVWNGSQQTAEEDLEGYGEEKPVLDSIDASPELRAAVVTGDYSNVDPAEKAKYEAAKVAEKASGFIYGKTKSVAESVGKAAEAVLGEGAGEGVTAMHEGTSAIRKMNMLSRAVSGVSYGTPWDSLQAWFRGLTDYSNVVTDKKGVPVGYSEWSMSERVAYNEWRKKQGLPDVATAIEEYDSRYPSPVETAEKAKSQLEGTVGDGSYDADQEAVLLETRYSQLGLPDNVIAEMEAMWDAYRAAKLGGYAFDASGYEQSIYDKLYQYLDPVIGDSPTKEKSINETIYQRLAILMENIQRLSPNREDLPENWFVYDHADDPWYNSGGGGGGKPYDFPAPISSAVNTALIAALQGIAQAYNPDVIAAAVEEAIIRGMSGVTIEQGNVVLSTGGLVGTLTPILNQKFGTLMGRAARG